MTRSTRVLVRSSTFISSQVFHAGLLLLLFCLALPSCQQVTEEVYPWQSGYRLGENLSRPKFEAIPTWFRVWAWTTPRGMEALYEQNFKGTLRAWVEESRRQLAAYFSDFPSPVLNSGAVHATPHLGASTAEAEENCAVMAADQLLDFLNFGNINNSVNFPALSLEPTEGFRLAVTNKNVAGMLGQLMSILADRNINVIDMINKSREEVAYNLIDVAAEPTPILLEEINAIDSVMNVRLFEI